MNSLAELKKLGEQLSKKEVYQSTFNFEICEIEKDEIQIVIKEEEKIFRSSNIYSQSMKDMCSSMKKVSEILKKEGTFMKWYLHLGFSKDKVSEFSKRQELYEELTNFDGWISSLGSTAVKEITKKEITHETRKEIAELGLKNLDDIRFWLNEKSQKENAIPIDDETSVLSEPFNDEIIEEFKELKNKIKTLKTSSDITQYKSQIKSLKRDMEELEEIIKQQEEEKVNENNYKLFDGSKLKVGDKVKVIELIYENENIKLKHEEKIKNGQSNDYLIGSVHTISKIEIGHEKGIPFYRLNLGAGMDHELVFNTYCGLKIKFGKND